MNNQEIKKNNEQFFSDLMGYMSRHQSIMQSIAVKRGLKARRLRLKKQRSEKSK